MSWLGYVLVFAAFFATHSVPLRPPVRDRLEAWLGRRGLAIAYSSLSLGMLGLLIHAAGRAPRVMLWSAAPWQFHVVQAGMLSVCLLLALTLGRPNPLSFGGAHNARFDPDRPGPVRLTRHPVLLALALWAGLDLLANGDLAHVLLFGVLGGFAIVGRGLVDRRKRHEVGADRWHDLRRRVALAPLLRAPPSWCALVARLAAGVGAYGCLILLHPVVIGVTAG